MAKITRGFMGRHSGRDPRLPPGQYDTGQHVAGPDRRSHAPARYRLLDLHRRRAGGPPDHLDLGRASTRYPRPPSTVTSTASRPGPSWA